MSKPLVLEDAGLASAPLRRVLSVALAGGNSIAEVATGWSELGRVVMLQRPVSDSFTDQFKADPALQYFAEPRSPHWPGDRGFVDDMTREAVSFPLSKAKGARK
jgi:hypothetical protein